jgi:hypothetical protein
MLLSEEDMQTLRDEHLLQPEDLILDPRDRDSDEGVVGRSKRDNKRSTIEDQMSKFNSHQSRTRNTTEEDQLSQHMEDTSPQDDQIEDVAEAHKSGRTGN